MDTYLTLKTFAEAQLTEKRSRFLAFAFHVSNEAEAKEIVAQYKKKFYDARHVCYAYVLDDNISQHTHRRHAGHGSTDGYGANQR